MSVTNERFFRYNHHHVDTAQCILVLMFLTNTQTLCWNSKEELCWSARWSKRESGNGKFWRGNFIKPLLKSQSQSLWEHSRRLFVLTAISGHSRLSIAGRSCLMPSRLSRPDIPYFTHDWRNWGIISNAFLSSSLQCMMNLCDFSLVSVSLCWSGQWKQPAQCTAERLPPLSSL